MRLKILSGKQCKWAFLGTALASSLVLSVAFSEPGLCLTCKPAAHLYGENAGSAPWNASRNMDTWRTCPTDYEYDGYNSCCASEEVGLKQGELIYHFLELGALGLLAMAYHGFFISLNVMLRR